MLSELELRGLIEGSFLPRRCECIKAQDASLTIKIYAKFLETEVGVFFIRCFEKSF